MKSAGQTDCIGRWKHGMASVPTRIGYSVGEGGEFTFCKSALTRRQALHPNTAQWIIDNRGMAAVGTDAVGFDAGNIVDWPNSVHTVRVYCVI
jgi:hypothetical protein